MNAPASGIADEAMATGKGALAMYCVILELCDMAEKTILANGGDEAAKGVRILRGTLAEQKNTLLELANAPAAT
jgi:hypothetical protein